MRIYHTLSGFSKLGIPYTIINLLIYNEFKVCDMKKKKATTINKIKVGKILYLYSIFVPM